MPLVSAARRSFFVAFITALAASCSEPAPTASGADRGVVALAPRFSVEASAAAQHLADFGIQFDRVRVVLVRPPADTVADTTIAFRPGQPALVLNLTVPVHSVGERLNATVQFLDNSTVLFDGTTRVLSHAPTEPNPEPTDLELHYVGPGASTARLVIAQRNVATSGAGMTFTVQAFDSAGQVVPTVPVSWTASDGTLASITQNGVFQPAGRRGTVTVRAETPTGISDQVSVVVTPAPATIALVSGGGQAGTVGQSLAQPVTVEVRAADGLGAAGVAVTFTPPASGAAGAAALTDAQGRTSSTITLGRVAGAQSFVATAAGFAVTIGATATAGAAAAISAVSGGGQQGSIRNAFLAPLVAKVVDQFGNAVSGATVNWTRAGAGTLSAASTTTSADGTTSVTYTAGATIGTETVSASLSGVSAAASFALEAVAATPTAVVVVSGDGQSATVNSALGNRLVVRVTDVSGFAVNAAMVTWSGNNAVPDATTSTTDAQGLASITARVGGTVGAASITATIVNGKSATFAATANAAPAPPPPPPPTVGPPTQLQFRVNPANSSTAIAIAPAVQVALLDAAGAQTTSTAAVTLTLTGGTSGAALQGSATRNAVGGIATFDNISVSLPGTGYMLVAASSGLTSATSAAFAVTNLPVAVTLSSVNQTVCVGSNCTSVPANLSNISGQIDVTLNVTGSVTSVAAILKCGTDSLVSSLALGLRAPVGGEVASMAPATVSINTAAFNATTGVPALRNGACTLRGAAVPTSSSLSVYSGSTGTTLNNADITLAKMIADRRAVDGSGQAWYGGDMTVTVTPVMYSGRTPVSATVGWSSGVLNQGSVIPPAGNTSTVSNGSLVISFPSSAVIGGTFGLGVFGLTPTVTVVDNLGGSRSGFATFTIASLAPVTSATSTTGVFNFDNLKPVAGVLSIQNNALQNTGVSGYVSGSFRFVADSAAGFCGPNATGFNAANQNTTTRPCTGANPASNLDRSGVGGVTVAFESALASGGAFTAVTSGSTFAETPTSIFHVLRQITRDALGNADTSYVNGAPWTSGGTAPNASKFGIDLVAPTLTVAGPPPNGGSLTIGGVLPYSTTVSDALSGARPMNLVAQTRQHQNVTTGTAMPAENTVFAAGNENLAGPCVIGRWNATLAAAGPSALPAYERNGAILGYCTPTLYLSIGLSANLAASSGYATTRIVGIDNAGNQSAAFTNSVVEDNSDPQVASLDLPATLVGGSSALFYASVVDNLDITASWAAFTYASPTNGSGAMTLVYPLVFGPGIAFDNVLTRQAVVNPTVSVFIKNLQVSNGSTIQTAVSPAGDATSITISTLDVVRRTNSGTATLAPGVTLIGGSGFSQNFTGGFSLGASTNVVTNCAGCTPVNPTAVTFTATAAGAPGVGFLGPFLGGVQLWIQVTSGGNWFLGATCGGGVARDDATHRFWDYSCTIDPPAFAQDGTSLSPSIGSSISVNVRAIGISANGDGIASLPIAISVTNP